VGYKYPHDFPAAVVRQTYAEGIPNYYEPSNHGFERTIAERMKGIGDILGK
jgi:putative ATPase